MLDHLAREAYEAYTRTIDVQFISWYDLGELSKAAWRDAVNAVLKGDDALKLKANADYGKSAYPREFVEEAEPQDDTDRQFYTLRRKKEQDKLFKRIRGTSEHDLCALAFYLSFDVNNVQRMHEALDALDKLNG